MGHPPTISLEFKLTQDTQARAEGYLLLPRLEHYEVPVGGDECLDRIDGKRVGQVRIGDDVDALGTDA